MPYIGKNPVGGGFHKLDALTASATDTYALTLNSAAYYPESANQLLVSLNGVIQAPQDSFTVSGSNIVFATALTAADSIDFVVALGDVLAVKTVTDGAITTNKIGTDAVTTAKIQDGAVTAAKIDSLPTGSVLQVKQTIKDDVFSTTGTTAHEDITGLSVSITPNSTSSKVLITVHLGTIGVSLNGGASIRIYRDSTVIGDSDQGTSDPRDGSIAFYHNNQTGIGVPASFSFLDSPSTASATTYKVSIYVNAGTGYVNQLPLDSNWKSASTITVMEIAG